MSEWQPMDTAPKNENFLAYDPLADAQMVLCWDEIEKCWVVPWDYSKNPDCTHWMPLPAPPNA